jgi:hypothetical protein
LDSPIIGGYREAEQYTGLSRRTLGRLLPSIAHIRINSRTLFTRAGLDSFLSRHTVKPKEPRKVADVDRIVARLRRGAR